MKIAAAWFWWDLKVLIGKQIWEQFPGFCGLVGGAIDNELIKILQQRTSD